MTKGESRKADREIERRSYETALEKFGQEVLRRKRERLGLTTSQMGLLIGVDKSRVSRIERGDGTPKDPPTVLSYVRNYQLTQEELQEWFELMHGIQLHKLIARKPNFADDQSANETTSLASQLYALGASSDLLEFLNAHFERTNYERRQSHSVLAQTHARMTADILADLLREQSPNPQELANELLKLARSFEDHNWTTALTWSRLAERVFGPHSNGAAQAAGWSLVMLWNIGDYYRAQDEVERIRAEYWSDMDQRTKADFFKWSGVIDLYLGKTDSAIASFNQTLKVAHRLGDIRVGEQHFLGRAYSEKATWEHDKQTQEEYFRKSLKHYDKALEVSARYGTDDNIAFHLLGKARILRLQGNKEEAQLQRQQARARFTNKIVLSHVNLEEAKIQLLNNDTRTPEKTASAAFEGWSPLRFAKGISDAFTIWGLARLKQGKVVDAIELLVAGLFLHPFDGHITNRIVYQIIQQIATQEDVGTFYRILRRIEDLAQKQQSYFSVLANISLDRTADIPLVVNKLALDAVRARISKNSIGLDTLVGII